MQYARKQRLVDARKLQQQGKNAKGKDVKGKKRKRPQREGIEEIKQRLQTELQQRKSQSKTKPNDPCPCGSAKKFKKCCDRPGEKVQKLHFWEKVPPSSNDHTEMMPKVHKLGVNDPCPCGLGRKVKKCCGIRSAQAFEAAALQEKQGIIGEVDGDVKAQSCEMEADATMEIDVPPPPHAVAGSPGREGVGAQRSGRTRRWPKEEEEEDANAPSCGVEPDGAVETPFGVAVAVVGGVCRVCNKKLTSATATVHKGCKATALPAAVVNPTQSPDVSSKQKNVLRSDRVEQHTESDDNGAELTEEQRQQLQELIEQDEQENDQKRKEALEAKKERRRLKKKKGKGKYKKGGSYCSAQLAGIEISDSDNSDAEDRPAATKLGKLPIIE